VVVFIGVGIDLILCRTLLSFLEQLVGLELLTVRFDLGETILVRFLVLLDVISK
jgi:hypothetical protein